MKFEKDKQSVLGRLSKNAHISLRNASVVSDHFREENISVISVFLGILLNEDCIATKVLTEMGIERTSLIKLLSKGKFVEITKDISERRKLSFSTEVQEVLRRAFDFAQRMSLVYVGTEHLMLGVLGSDHRALKKLSKLGLSVTSFQNSLNKVAMYPVGILARTDDLEMVGKMGSIIDFIGTDLVALGRNRGLDPVVGREEEMDLLINILSRRKKNNPLIVGEAGVGKTVLVEGLAQRIADGRVPPSLKDMRIVSLDVASIIAGSKMRGDIEEKIMTIVNDVISSNNTILFIDEIHNIATGGIPGSSSDIASVLKPALLQEGFRCIGATTTEDYTAFFESDSALSRRFQPVSLKEASVEDSVIILKNVCPLLEKHHSIGIEEDALKMAVILSDRYVSGRYLPDKAIDLLDEAAASKRLRIESQFSDLSFLQSEIKALERRKNALIVKGKMEEAVEVQKKESIVSKKLERREKICLENKRKKSNKVNPEDIRSIVSKWTGIPLNTLGSKEKSALLKLEGTLNASVVGQEEACSSVASAIKRARTGIVDIERPWASFLFLGPTGVGKTELAKVLTRELFGDEKKLVQIDMSEMMEMHSVSKLIGSPPGYVGFQQGGWLTERVRREPHSVILFDEVEKAHPDVLNILLQILEYGHLADGRGKKVNFKNTVVILTSNIGAEEISRDKVLGFVGKGEKERNDTEINEAYGAMKITLLDELRGTLRPELLNRLDDIVIFRSLTRKDARKIVKLLLSDLNRRLGEENIIVSLDKESVNYVVKNSFDEQYGARPLRRFLQDRVENILADFMLENPALFEKKRRVELEINVVEKTLSILKNN